MLFDGQKCSELRSCKCILKSAREEAKEEYTGLKETGESES